MPQPTSQSTRRRLTNADLASGNLAISTSGAGVGASVTVVVRDSVVTARIADGADVRAGGDLTVEALQTGDYLLLAVGGAGGNSVGVGGSVTVFVLERHDDGGASEAASRSTASAVGCTNVTANPTQDVVVTASDETTALDLAGVHRGRRHRRRRRRRRRPGHRQDDGRLDRQRTRSSAPTATSSCSRPRTKTSSRSRSAAVGGGTAAVNVNVTVPVITITTTASIGSGADVRAGGNVLVMARRRHDPLLDRRQHLGRRHCRRRRERGRAGRHEDDHGDHRRERPRHGARAGGAHHPLHASNAGSYATSGTDIRFDPRGTLGGWPVPFPSGSPLDGKGVQADGATINLGYNHGFKNGQQVVYDAGGGAPIGGLVDGETYYVDA